MRKLFKATLIVTIFSVLTRALGFVLKIILSRRLGAEVLGSYQVAMSIFSVMMTLVASGIPLIVSRSVAYKKSAHDNNGAYKTVSAGLVLTLGISIILSIVLVIFPQILELLIGKTSKISIVLLTLPALIASAIYCVLRSSLWGDKRFFSISFTEFFEQVARIILCLILFSPTVLTNMDLGEKSALSLSLACILSCLMVIVIYFGLKNKLKSPFGAFKPLIKSSAPITTLRTVSSLVSSCISLIIPLRLTLYGYTQAEAMAQFGLIMGMAFPLIMIPGTLIGSLAVTLVPEISSKTDNIDDPDRVKDKQGLKNHITLGVNMSIVISTLMMPAFMSLGVPIAEVLFKSAEAGKYISAGAILMLPLGINQITSSMLNSIGLEIKSLKNYAIGAVMLFLSIFFLPKYIGTYALIVGMFFLSGISATLNIRMLKKRALLDNSFIKYIILCLGFTFFSQFVGGTIYKLLLTAMPMILALIISAVAITSFMLIFALVFNIAGINGFIFHKRKKKKQNRLN